TAALCLLSLHDALPISPQGAASFGWTAYAPLSNTTFTPGAGGNLWVLGLALQGFGTILGSVNFITTVITMRAPGMTVVMKLTERSEEHTSELQSRFDLV